MANELKFGNKVVFLNGLPLTLPIAASDPVSATAGDEYYNSTSNTIRYYNGTSWLGASGTVTSVTVQENDGANNIFSSSGSPITTSGTINLTLVNQSANMVFAGPSTGSPAVPTFRALVLNDLPTIPYSKLDPLTANRALQSDGSGYVSASAVTNVELGYLSGVTSGVQSQLDGMLKLAGRSGGQIAHGGIAASEYLELSSTAHATKASVVIRDGSSFINDGDPTNSMSSLDSYFQGVNGTCGTVTVNDGTVYGNHIMLGSNGQGPYNESNSAGGTFAAPTVMTSNSVLQFWRFFGYSDQTAAADYMTGQGRVADFTVRVGSSALSSTNHGARFVFSSAQLNTVVQKNRLILDETGQVTIGDASLSSGINLSWAADASGDIGDAAGTHRPNNAYIKSLMQSGSAQITGFTIAGVVHNDASGNLSSSLIVDADVASAAAIAYSKLAALTSNRALQSNGSGFVSVSAVTSTELGYLSGVTSSVQTQLDARLKTDGTNSMLANLNFGSFKGVNLADPTAAQDAVTKAYVDSLLDGRSWKNPVRVASTANINLAVVADPSPVDGITLANGDRILLKNQTAPAENGIYVAVSAVDPTTWVRSSDANTANELEGAAVFVEEGTVNHDYQFAQTSDSITVGTTALVWVVTSANSFSGHDMISLIGGQISVDLASASGLESTNPGNAAGQLRIKLEASNPSLKFTGSNELATKLDPAGTITSGANGLKVGVDNVTIEIASNALQLKAGGITNIHVNASAAIAYSKLAALTINRALQSDGSGFVSVSAVTNVELGYLSGVTSAIQTQIDSKANRFLSNLQSPTAINQNLLFNADNTFDIGASAASRPANVRVVSAVRIGENADATASYIRPRGAGALAGTLEIGAGTNTHVAIQLNAGASEVFRFHSVGNLSDGYLAFGTDNTFDFGRRNDDTAGVSTARPRSIYVGTSILNVAGTATAPSYSFAGVTGNGLYNVDANTLGFASAGIERVSIGKSSDSGGQISLWNVSAAAISGTLSAIDTRLFIVGAGQIALGTGTYASMTRVLDINPGDVTIRTGINLLFQSDNANDIGASGANRPAFVWVGTAVKTPVVDSGASSLTLKTSASNANVIVNANGTGSFDIEATKIRRSASGADTSNFMEDQYFDSLSLTANISSATEISSSLSFALASFDSAIVNYKIKEATSNKVRIGQFIVTTDGTIASSSDQFSETALLGSASGLVLTADISGGNVRILYNNTHASNGATIRVHIRKLRT